MSSHDGGSGAVSGDGGSSAEWRRIYGRVEAQVEVLAAGLARLEALNGILQEYGDARDNINQARLHQAELSRSRWEAACKELLPQDSPKLAELLECDLEDSRLCKAVFEIENSELKIQLKEVRTRVELSENTADHEIIARDLREELRKLKQGYETLCANKDKAVSTLHAEKDFVWNQLRATEKDKDALLKIKEWQGAQATEATHNLQKNMEELQLAAIFNKDDEVRGLRAEALAAKSKLLVAEGKLYEMHSLAKEKDIQKLKDGQLKSLKCKHTSLPNEGYETLCTNKDSAALFKIKEVEGAQATEATHKLQKIVEELQVPARNKDDEIRRDQAEALVVQNMLLAARDRLDEVHSWAKEEDIQTLKDQQLETRKRKHASLPSESIQIFVDIFYEMITLKVKISDTEAKIQDKVGLRPCDQLLFRADQHLKGCCTLADYDIQKKSTLKVLPLRNYIHVHMPSSPHKVLGLVVERSDTICDVKAKIQVKRGITRSRQILLRSGKRLRNSRTLADYSIAWGDDLALQIRPRRVCQRVGLDVDAMVIGREQVPLPCD